jgi:hypothetical protein
VRSWLKKHPRFVLHFVPALPANAGEDSTWLRLTEQNKKEQ